MAAGGSLDDLLNSKVDESAFTALVGTLEDQLYSGQVSNVVSSASGSPNVSSTTTSALSVVGSSRADTRVPANGVQHGVVAQDGGKTVPSNVSKGAVVIGAGRRVVSAHSQAGVIQTGHFPLSSQAAGSPVNSSNASKVVQSSGSHASVVGATHAISSSGLFNGSASGTQAVVANGRQATVGNKTGTVAQSGSVPTVITVNRSGGPAVAPALGVAGNNALTSGVQIISVNQARGQSPGMQKTLAPRIVLSPQALNRAASPGQPIALQTLQGLQNSGAGHILVRTENGHLKLIQLPVQGGAGTVAVTTIASSPLATTPSCKWAAGAPRGLYQRAAGAYPPPPPPPPPLPTPPPPPPPASYPPYAPHGYLPNVYKTPAPTTPRTATAAPAQPASQTTTAMPTDAAKLKCKNFLATLLKLAKDQPETVARNVRLLIQNLIDARVEPEAFTTRLQQELNSSPQPCLVPFLKKSLPLLRQSLYSREITIEGVKPPPPSALPTPLGTVPSMHTQPRQVTVAPAVSAASSVGTLRLVSGAGAAPRTVSTHPALLNIQPFQSAAKLVRAPTPSGSASASAAVAVAAAPAATLSQTAAASRQPPVFTLKKDKRLSFKSSLESGQDDDINDVAAMGGVNLQEESQNILGSTEFVGTQIRSIKDETFLPSGSLQLRIRQIAMKHGLEEPGQDVMALVSHATQERLKTLLERLAVIAEHRLEVVKSESRYEVSRDVRGQLRFLEELDKLERKRHEETEREMLLRAAKSRSKAEDPEQAKLKAKAKEMQRLEMEEVRQREANRTALDAIGPRKKPRLEGEPAAADGPTVSGALSQRQVPLRPRLKRVNVRDLLLLLEQERAHQRSQLLYRLFVK